MTLALLCCLACLLVGATAAVNRRPVIYVPYPTASDVQPSSGRATDTVTVSGANFCGSGGASLQTGFSVYFGDNNPADAQYYGTPDCAAAPNTVTVVVPPGSGTVTVVAGIQLTLISGRGAEHTVEKRDTVMFTYLADGTE
jgi:energy-converting hydrogenase Eha subunit B